MKWEKIFSKMEVMFSVFALSMLLACQSVSLNASVTDTSSFEKPENGNIFTQVDERQEEMEVDTNMQKIEIIVGNRSFFAELSDNAQAFADMLPLTLTMSELNGNEKLYYLSESLPTNAVRPSSIHTGDLMLFGSDCLVLFYKDFSTSYSYTSLGRIEDASGLTEAVGSGNIMVTFQQKNILKE